MKINEMLAGLRHEREQVEDAILSLERIEHGRCKRHGEPPSGIKLKKLGRPLGSWNRVKVVPLAS